MNNMLIPVLTALLIGVLAGVLTQWPQVEQNDIEKASDTRSDLQSAIDRENSISYSPARMRNLENELQQIKQRLSDLERSLENDARNDSSSADTNASPRPNRRTDPLTEANLVKAGVNAELAADIMRRQEELEYQRLALRDRAIRGDYLRDQRYYNELGKLKEQTVDLRKEIGDQAYDRYLFQTQQSNRVSITSVMSGSPAAQNGMQEGDILLRYDNNVVFSWRDMREMTSQGQLGDYVSVEVLRNGQPINLVMPRGPLGVKLTPTRSEPANAY
jgi:hypothetical protein